jgi:Ni,Fe-hydrogenase I small subunit
MKSNQAIKAFSQSEKLKSALIWATQLIQVHLSLAESDKPGAEKIIKTLISMIANEITVAQKAAPHDDWFEAEKNVNTAIVMLNSGVAHDSGYHLTQALSKVTNVGQQSMTLLIDEGLL